MGEVYRVIVVGVGKRGKHHVTAFQKNPRFEVVGIADLRTSTEAAHVIITYALGSCLGITAYDPVAKVGGLVHVMVPSSDLDPARAAASPATSGATTPRASSASPTSRW